MACKSALLFFCYALLISFCSSSAVASPAGTLARVGVIAPLSGEFSRYGERVITGIRHGAEEDLALSFEDEGCQASKAIAAFQKLNATDGIRLFIGPGCGSPQVSVAPLLARTGALAILGNSAPQRVYGLSKGRMLSVQHSLEQESAYNASAMSEKGVKSVVIVFMESDFGRAHEASFREHFKGEILETFTYATDASGLRALLPRLIRLNPDALYVPDVSPFFHGLMPLLQTLSGKRPHIFSVYSFQSQDTLNAVGTLGEGIRYSYPRIEADALEYFPQLAAQVLLRGVRACGSDDPDCVRTKILEAYRFDSQGVLAGELGLKSIKNGLFSWEN